MKKLRHIRQFYNEEFPAFVHHYVINYGDWASTTKWEHNLYGWGDQENTRFTRTFSLDLIYE